MLCKSFPAMVKAAGEPDGLQEGQFTALVSVFGNVDAYGDVVVPGAFTDTLAAWEASGSPIPVYWSHRMDDPDYNIGQVLTAVETDQGLRVNAQLDLEAPKAAQVYRLLKGRRVTQFSFSYDIADAGWAHRDGAEVYELRKLKLYEVGPTPIGANPETELLAVKAATGHLAGTTADLKAARFKAGRVLSARNESTLRQARDQAAAATEQIDEVLASLPPVDQPVDQPGDVPDDDPASDQNKDQPRGQDESRDGSLAGRPEEPAAANTAEKAAEKNGRSPATVRLLTELDLLAAN